MATGRRFSREFKIEAVRLVKDRGVASRRQQGIWISMRAFWDDGLRNWCRTSKMPFPAVAT